MMKTLPSRDSTLTEAGQVFLQHFGELAHTQDVAYEYLSSIWRTLIEDLRADPPPFGASVDWKLATTHSRDFRTRAENVNGPSGTFEIRLRAVGAPAVQGEELRRLVQEHLRFFAQDSRARPSRGGATIHVFAAFQNQGVARRVRDLLGPERYEAARRSAVEGEGWQITGDPSVLLSRDLSLPLESLGADVAVVDEGLRQLVAAVAPILTQQTGGPGA